MKGNVGKAVPTNVSFALKFLVDIPSAYLAQATWFNGTKKEIRNVKYEAHAPNTSVSICSPPHTFKESLEEGKEGYINNSKGIHDFVVPMFIKFNFSLKR